jgi:hypothetical protein
MKILRTQKSSVIVDREMLEDTCLSFGAKGVMAYIESQGDEWDINGPELVNAAGDSWPTCTYEFALETVDRYLEELIALGYLERA